MKYFIFAFVLFILTWIVVEKHLQKSIELTERAYKLGQKKALLQRDSILIELNKYK